MQLNEQAAIDAGYTKEEIEAYKASNAFDVEGAKSAGYSDQEIADHRSKLGGQEWQVPTTVEGAVTQPFTSTKREMMFEEPGAMRDAEEIVKGFQGERVGLDPENYRSVEKYAGVATPLVHAGVAGLEASAGALGAGISFAVDALDKLGLPNADLLKRDILAMATESPIGIPEMAMVKLPQINRASQGRSLATQGNRNMMPSMSPDDLRTPDGPPLLLGGPEGTQGGPRVKPSVADNVERVQDQVSGTADKLLTVVNEKIDQVFPVEKKTKKLIVETLKKDGVEVQNLPALVSEFEIKNNRRPTLLELGRDNTKDLVRKVGSEVGESRNIVEDFRTDTLNAQSQLVKDIAGRTLLNKDADYLDDVDALDDMRRKQSAPLYEAAHAEIVPINDTMIEIINTPSGRAATTKAMNLIKEDRRLPADLGIEKIKGQFVFADDVSVELLDYIKRGFSDYIDTKYRDKTTKRLVLDNLGRKMQSNLSEFVGEIDKVSENYALARQAYAGPSTLKDAFNDASKFVTKGKPRDMKARMKGMTEGEKDMFRSGFMRGIMDLMTGANRNANNTRKLIKSEDAIEKLTIIFDDRAMAQSLINQLDDADTLGMKAQQVSSNIGTTTQQRQNAAGTFNAMSGGNADIFSTIIEKSYDKLRQDRNIRNQQLINEDVANLTTQPLTDDLLETLIKRLQDQ